AVVVDFGPGSAAPTEAERPPSAAQAPLVLADIQSMGLAEGSTALQYRLVYDDAQQLRAYQRARWSQPPANLLRQSVASELARQRPVLDTRTAREAARGDAGAMLVLRLDLEEFSQVFTSAAQSHGVLRLRATLAETTPQGERLLGQRLFVAQAPATSQDAAGGSAALAQAAQQAAREIAAWVEQAAL
ncbi:MAG: ABC-type transport auxiliary lipoprotein family protein, partial [Giesbergeria sp.]